jgi:hypothetical protein
LLKTEGEQTAAFFETYDSVPPKSNNGLMARHYQRLLDIRRHHPFIWVYHASFSALYANVRKPKS